MPVVLIGTNRTSGKIVEVGLYDDTESARPYVGRNGGRDVLYSVWTPEMNDTMQAPSVVGFSLPPQR